MLFFGWGSFGFLTLLVPVLLGFALLRIGMNYLRRMQQESDDNRLNLRGRGAVHRFVVGGGMATEHRSSFGMGIQKPFGRRSLDSRVFRLAYRNGGRVTVSQVVMETGMSLEQTEVYMDQLCNGVRVTMEVSDRGLLTYEFPELADCFDSDGPA